MTTPAHERADIQRCLTCAPADCACEGACFRVARRALFLERQIERLAARAVCTIDGDEIADYAPSWEAPAPVLPGRDAA